MTEREVLAIARALGNVGQAANPDLLEASIEALHALQQYGIHPIIQEHLKAAIAKAEGE